MKKEFKCNRCELFKTNEEYGRYPCGRRLPSCKSCLNTAQKDHSRPEMMKRHETKRIAKLSIAEYLKEPNCPLHIDNLYTTKIDPAQVM